MYIFGLTLFFMKTPTLYYVMYIITLTVEVSRHRTEVYTEYLYTRGKDTVYCIILK